MIDFSKRLTSSFGVSLATGLMLETCFTPTEERYDPNRTIPKKLKVDEYSYYFVNILTILRNLVESLEMPIETILKDKNCFATLVEELDIIKTLFGNVKNIEVIFYYTDIDKLQKHYNNGKPKIFTKKMENTKLLYKALHNAKLPDLDFYDLEIHRNITVLPKSLKQELKNSKILITTHIPPDLLNSSKTAPFTLLESHTGALIEEDKFSKKYNKIATTDMTIFPFREILIFYLGDNYTSSITSVKARKRLLELVPKWDKRITEAGIANYIRNNKDTSRYLHGYGALFKDFLYKA